MMIFKGIQHDSFQEDVEQCGAEQTAFSDTNCSLKPFAYLTIKDYYTGSFS
jgi:hypothetical protein